jgi:hypothetical protein
MRTLPFRVAAFGLLALIATSTAPARADFNVAPGWDLFQTDPYGSTIPGLGNVMGVPLGTFDFDNGFGRGVGVQNTGSTDAIIQRLQAVQIVGTEVLASTPIAMVALQLETVAPINFNGLGVDNYFVTLQSTHGGPASTGTDTLFFDPSGLGGAFNSSIELFYDVRKGSVTGAIVASSDIVLNSNGAIWGDLPPPGATTITNVNQFLSGVAGDPTQDFFVGGSEGRSVPEPSSLALLGLGAAATLGLARRRSRRDRIHA